MRIGLHEKRFLFGRKLRSSSLKPVDELDNSRKSVLKVEFIVKQQRLPKPQLLLGHFRFDIIPAIVE
jgi:hypothetical protein